MHKVCRTGHLLAGLRKLFDYKLLILQYMLWLALCIAPVSDYSQAWLWYPWFLENRLFVLRCAVVKGDVREDHNEADLSQDLSHWERVGYQICLVEIREKCSMVVTCVGRWLVSLLM